MLERIIYISAAREAQTQESLERILSVSRARNEASGVTGLLIGGSCWWLQVLEGQSSDLEPVWRSIRNDPRHAPVVMVQRRPLSRREFAQWSMNFRSAEDQSFDALVEEMTGGIRDPRVQDQIRRFGETFLRSGEDWSDKAA